MVKDREKRLEKRSLQERRDEFVNFNLEGLDLLVQMEEEGRGARCRCYSSVRASRHRQAECRAGAFLGVQSVVRRAIFFMYLGVRQIE